MAITTMELSCCSEERGEGCCRNVLSSNMAEMPFHLRFSLSRGQRLVPHLRIWGLFYSPFLILLFSFFVFAAVLNFSRSQLRDGTGFLLLASLVFMVARGFFAGLIDIIA